MNTPQGGVISRVLPGGIGREVGLEPGDILVLLNGHPLRDVIDYHYYGAEETLVLVIQRQGAHHRIEIERDYDEPLGIEFAEPVFDAMRLCTNQCPFCFVGQMPRGLRPSLYLRDDDYRYSFLTGSFVTLTNLAEDDWRRIGEQHLSPLYVSIHATDPAIRRAMLGNPSAPDIRQQLRRLAELGIGVHGQIVLVPGVNDGQVLRRSIEALAELWPTVATLAIVPVGLTRYQRRPLRPLGRAEAQNALHIIEGCAAPLRQRIGQTWAYPADELFLLAEKPMPEAAFYDRDDQRENGVGLVRELLTDWERTRHNVAVGSLTGRRVTLVCGMLIVPILRQLGGELAALSGLDVQLVPVMNRMFGETVTVSGLLTGGDVLAALAGRDLGERVYLPRAMYDASGRVTLDDFTRRGLAQRLGTAVYPVSSISEIAQQLAKEARKAT